MLSCKEVTDLASRALDTPLVWRQRFGMRLRLHLLFCRLCRSYLRHCVFSTGHESAYSARLKISIDHKGCG
ncbi:MAG: hypothetical protein ACRESZ_08020 [Methylococcales bacterium]